MLVLASASPRRQELLRNAGIPFVAQPSDIPEDAQPGESPETCAQRLAREKALAILQLRPDDFVLGADTIVVIDSQMLNKPESATDAARMLRLLSGHTHKVITGVCLVGRKESVPSFVDVRIETTKVSMSEISDREIQDYISTGEPMDKAGAYAIQGIASRWITRIEGDYCNVVGLPIALVYRMLKEHQVF